MLGLLGLLALTVYILACTSFSPDDKQVLYPAFTPPSGAIGLSLYHRETRRSELFFLPATYENPTNGLATTYVRGQWLADGRQVLCAWATHKSGDDDALNLALMPWGGHQGSVKLFRVQSIKDAAGALIQPLCTAGERAFFMAGDREVVRLDLKTGALVHHVFTNAEQQVQLLPGLDGKQVFYEEKDSGFGRLDPESFGLTRLVSLTNNADHAEVFAYDRDGTTVASLQSQGASNQLAVLRGGSIIFRRALAPTNSFKFGYALFSPKGNSLWASYQRTVSTNKVAYGLMEIPLSDAPLREVPLIPAAPGDRDSLGLFQFGMSHDGKTAAVASTYLAEDDLDRPEDYALFFVDLKDPKHPVTKVALPPPPKQ